MKPLIITDCDEVLMHFAMPFGDYLSDVHDMDLRFESFSLAGSIKRRACGSSLSQSELEPLIDGFFETHIETQQPVIGAVDALRDLSELADIVVLTNHLDADRQLGVVLLDSDGAGFEQFKLQTAANTRLIDI